MEDGVDGRLFAALRNRKLHQIYRASCSARMIVALTSIYHSLKSAGLAAARDDVLPFEQIFF